MTDWCRSKNELRVCGNASSSLLWFYPFDKISPSASAGLDFSFARHQQHFPGVVRICTVWILAGLAVWKLEGGRYSIISALCLCIPSPENILHFLSCFLPWLSVPVFDFLSAHGKLSCFPHEALLMQALRKPSLPCKGSTAFQWDFKQLHKLFVSHHKTPFSLLKASLKHLMYLHVQIPDLRIHSPSPLPWISALPS